MLQRRAVKSAGEVFAAARSVLGDVDTQDIFGTGRAERTVRCREAIVGALRALGYPQPSHPEIAAMMRRPNHSVVMEMWERYSNQWPGVLRELWESAVLLQLGVKEPGGPAPGAKEVVRARCSR